MTCASLRVQNPLKSINGRYVKHLATANFLKRLLQDVVSGYMDEIMMMALYPRLDESVSKQTEHELRLPFSYHNKSGYICLPVDPNLAKIDEPPLVTLELLDKELCDTRQDNIVRMQSGIWEKTSLAQGVRYTRAVMMQIQSRHGIMVED